MDSGYYAAMTGLVARTEALDTAASNLANAQTPGYRAEREFFRSVLLGPDALASQLGHASTTMGCLGGDRLSLAQGALQETGNPLDLAIEGQGFFMVQAPNGLRYTRDGGFHREPGRATGDWGRRGGSFRGGPGDSDSAGRGGSGRRRLDLGGGRRCGAGGCVRHFLRERSSHRKAPIAILRRQGVTATPSKDASVHQGAIEAANQDVVQGSLDLIVMQRQAEMMQRALTVFHTDFNKFATEDLPRI